MPRLVLVGGDRPTAKAAEVRRLCEALPVLLKRRAARRPGEGGQPNAR